MESSSLQQALDAIEPVLSGTLRADAVAEFSKARDLGRALMRLRDAMRAHSWRAGGQSFELGKIIRRLDNETRQEGFHVLHDWDGKKERVLPDMIVVDVLNYILDQRGTEPVDAPVLAILVDYYFMYLLALLSLRAWDAGDPNSNYDRIGRLLQELQGPRGSGQRFADNAETLMLIATSHYEPNEDGYELLLRRVRTLDRAHQATVGLTHAQAMGAHLRFGFEATYGRDTILMRKDNVADYPWLCYALTTVMHEYARMVAEGAQGVQKDMVVEALLNALTPDARAFVGEPPSSLVPYESDRRSFHDCFHQHRDTLLPLFDSYRPLESSYSALSFFFNFSQNVLKGTVIDALLRGEPWRLSLNDLFTGISRSPQEAQAKEMLAKILMAYARLHPDTIRGRLMPAIVYDPVAGRQAFSVAMRKIRE